VLETDPDATPVFDGVLTLKPEANSEPVGDVAAPAPADEQVTVVVPTGKNEPDGGVQVIVPQVPVDVGGG